MQTVNLRNISFNKLKEFTSLCSKKNTTIKGKFTLTGEYEILDKDGGGGVTLKKIWEVLTKLVDRIDHLEKRMDSLEKRVDHLEYSINKRLDNIVKLNNLKE